MPWTESISVLRVSLDSYLRGVGTRVYSFVASIPFSPLDIDLGRLARGEWNALTDRFRLWYLPSEDGVGGEASCYVMLRKFDLAEGVLLYGHVVINMGARSKDASPYNFTVGIMSNDDIRARSALNSMLEIPPSFHRRSEVRLIERKWRSDPEAVMRFLANIHSSMAQLSPSGKTYTLKFEPPPGMMGELKRNLSAWWQQ